MKGRVVYSTLSTAPSYRLLTPDGLVETEESEKRLEMGDWVDSETLEKMPESEIPEVKQKVEDYLKKNCEPKKFDFLVQDAGMESIRPALEDAARYLMRSVIEFTPMIIRYHDDCDGLASALLVKKALESFAGGKEMELRAIYKQADSAVYSRWELERDFEDALKWPKKPLMIFLDHAANQESEPQLRELKEAEYPTLVIDHHPPAEEVHAHCFASPHGAEGDSNHNAGLLCYEVARMISGGANEELAWWSMQADHSSFRRSDEEHEPFAIDFVIRTTERPRIEKYEELLKSKALLDFNYRKASILLEHSLEHARGETKSKQRGGLTYYLTDLSFIPKGGYPSKGRVLNSIAKEHEGEESVCLGYGDTTILFRVSPKAHEKGYKANEVIALLKKEFANDVYSGGGHECAASTRFKAGSTKKILNRIQTL